MAVTTIVFGALLAALGLGGWAATGMQHPTALIPAGLGVVWGALGGLALKDSLRKHAMHLAAALGLLGLLGACFMLARKIPQLITEGRLTHPDGTDSSASFVANAVMAVLCAAFVGLCVRSFIDARRRRKAGAEAPAPATR
jgi:hypothetical protein